MSTTQRHEIEAWLGDGWTEQQIQQITDTYLRLEPDTDPDEREALLVALAQHADGTADRAGLVDADIAAQAAASRTRVARRAALRADVAAGMSEVEAARVYQVARETVRAWIGKRGSGWSR